MDVSYIDKMNQLGEKWDRAARAVIQVHRIIANLSEDEVAKLLGVKRAVIVNFEKGRDRVALGDVHAFARAFGIRTGTLFD